MHAGTQIEGMAELNPPTIEEENPLRHREHVGAGRPMHWLSCEHVLIVGRPICAAHFGIWFLK